MLSHAIYINLISLLLQVHSPPRRMNRREFKV
uniref:Uncharacterized protein n=1 Tax=Zea mays TaxID=4577 RepID=C0PAJ7_MAIZE|nr:unknown [Zea mays]